MSMLTVSALAFLPAFGALAVHVVEIDHPVMSPDEGLLLGNGDLSCSVYQTANDLVFRLGKGDVWDRRFDFSKQPKPPTVDEIIDGVLNCGWKVTGWNATNVEEMKKMPKGERLLEITRGKSALRSAPYPTPKPTGEMRFRLPLDLGQPEKVVQRLFIEEGRATFDFSWKRGAYRAVFEAAIDPEINVLAVRWNVDGWREDTRLTEKPPVYVSVHRWADPDYETWLRKEIEEYPSYPGKPTEFNPGVTPLPPPQVLAGDTIEQRFHPDPLFPDGFRYRLTLKPLLKCGAFWRPALPSEGKDAYITLTGGKATTNGAVALAVTTSRDKTLTPPPPKLFDEYLAAAKKAGAEYWAKSAFSMPGDKFLEDLWYSTYHARRAVLRSGTVPPGLFFPSSLPDYSRWNGDYHANYNLQSIYWGDFTANRLDQAETFMDAVEFALPIGRKIAKEYYNCRGCFFQLQQFPCLATEDYNGTLPLGRMAYMTGWMMNHYWEYYMFTKDKEWLAKRGYPFIKECALFYLDFLKKAPHPKLPPDLKDGKYHLFPSVQGESGFKDPMDFCDKDQVVVHCRHALWGAIESSKILGVDEDLRAEWQDRLDNLVRSDRLKQVSPYERHCILCRSPGDGGGAPWQPAPAWDGKPAGRRDTYLGISHWSKIGIARSPGCIPERDFAAWRRDLVDWTHANGLVWGMAIRIWQRTGGWTESLSCMAPFQEMILQSWDGAIRLFPRWPLAQDVSVRSWRAQGAFLVDADFAGGKIGSVSVTSEKGEDCLVWGDWKVKDSVGKTVATDRDEFGRLRFNTVKGGVYALKEAGASKSSIACAAEPTVAEIESAILVSATETAALQARLSDRVSLADYEARVTAVNGTNIWTAALQQALDEHEIIVIPGRAAKYFIDGTIRVPSNRRIEANGATIALLPGTDVVMLRNERASDGTLAPTHQNVRDDNVAIVGGRWEDWRRARAGYGKSGRWDMSERKVGNYYGVSTLMLFNCCDHISLKGVTFAHTSAFAYQGGNGSDIHLVDTVFDRCMADGYHLNGNLSRVCVRNARGQVGDDLVALNAYDWLDSSVTFGPQKTILCEDLELLGDGYPAIRILPATYRYGDGTEVDCSISDVVFRRVKGIKCFKMYLQTPNYAVGTEPEWSKIGSGGNLHFEDIEIDLDRPIDMFEAYTGSDPVRGHFGAFEFGANLTSIHFKNLKVNFHADRYPYSHLAVVGPKSVRVTGKNGEPREVFDPYVSCRVGKVVVENLEATGVVPSELVHATVFDDVNGDGRSTGRGEIADTQISTVARSRELFNGKLVNKATRVVPARGKIQLQSEGCGVEFRRITLTCLKKER